MAVPANAVYRNGQTPVTGDQYNTFVQGSPTVAALRTFVGQGNMLAELLGTVTAGDGGAGMFWWNPSSTAPDDGINVIVPPAAASGAWNRLPITALFSSGDFSGPPILPGYPLGQSGNLAYSLVEITTETVQAAISEFALSVNMTSSTGSSGSVATSANKVGIYVAVEATAGSGNVWAFNPVLILDPGACTIGGAQIVEFDLANNSGVDFGTDILTAGLHQPALIGMQLTGLGANSASTALAILGSSISGGGLWNAGIYIGVNNVNVVGILDEGALSAPAARIGYAARQLFTNIIDTSAAIASGSAILLGTQQKISWRNAADDADLTVLQTDGSDNLRFGSASVALIEMFSPTIFAPGAPVGMDDDLVVAGATTLAGAVAMTGTTLGFYAAVPVTKPTITGSRGGNAALADLLTKLATTGLITDGTTA